MKNPDICFMLHESVANDQTQRGICWQITDHEFRPIKHPQIKNPVLRVSAGSLLESLNKLPTGAPGFIEPNHNSTFRIFKGEMRRGNYYPRIVRPIFGEEHLIQSGQTFRKILDQNALRNIQKQEEILIELLEEIFRSVHPHESNFFTYGHHIRNLLILAATEVESSLTAILRANSITPQKNYYTTKDYVRLKKTLRLDEFEVSLAHYPWLSPFSPFLGWDSDQPTKSLSWYDGYNTIKHNRETEFEESKLEHSIRAVIAVHILLVSQFGHHATHNPYFRFKKEPCWNREDLYIPPEDSQDWVEENLQP
jgi:hypothetical protein